MTWHCAARRVFAGIQKKHAIVFLMGPVEEVRITTLSFNRILRNGAYHLTTRRRLAEYWNPQLQIRGNLTTLKFENIIFVIQLLLDTLYFTFRISFQVQDNEAEDSSYDAGQESEECQKNSLMDCLVCSIVTLARILFGDYPATNHQNTPPNNTLLLV